MFIIWGFGKTTMKRYGEMLPKDCFRCYNKTERELVKVTTWFTLFFIPLIPYRREYYLVCPVCQAADQLSKQEFVAVKGQLEEFQTTGRSIGNVLDLNLSDPEEKEIKRDSYAGKTPTQIAYLKEMQEFNENK